VHEVLGKPKHSAQDGREWFLDFLAVDFNSEGIVEFIEVAESKEFLATFNGIDLHRVTVDETLAHVCQCVEYYATGAEVGFYPTDSASRLSPLQRATLSLAYDALLFTGMTDKCWATAPVSPCQFRAGGLSLVVDTSLFDDGVLGVSNTTRFGASGSCPEQLLVKIFALTWPAPPRPGGDGL